MDARTIELAELRSDIATLQAMVDAKVDQGQGNAILRACTRVLRDRKARLTRLELGL